MYVLITRATIKIGEYLPFIEQMKLIKSKTVEFCRCGKISYLLLVWS